ncbi:MAG: Coenzyme F420 hydrogenase subunit beta [Promethearchaeota archaeon]|nr:MAG: Coenzyme F420 hydrogenase subunit beta [Candidatus Lokiarchaeota archaeon]
MFLKKIQKGWKELKSEVIDSGRCVYCGACGAFCSNIKFDVDSETPYDDGSCEEMNTCREGYGTCYNLCPKTGIDHFPLALLDKWVFGKKHDKILGHYDRIISVKATEKAKQKIGTPEAGVISALLAVSMETGAIDSALVNKADNQFRPVPYIAQSPQELTLSTGYKPSQAPTLSILGDAINKENANIAVVGTPCQIQALRKIQNHPRFDFEAYDLVSLAISTFCFGTFQNQKLQEVLDTFGVDPISISKVEKDLSNFHLTFSNGSQQKAVPLNILYDNTIREACFACSDYSGSFADISVGEVGSNEEWTTCILRTKKGNEIFELALEQGFINTKELDKDLKQDVVNMTRSKIEIVEIEDIEIHSPEIKSFWVRSTHIAEAYRPGNFVVLWLPDIDFLPMSVSQVNGDLLEITVQKIGEGTSALFDMNIGDTIGIRGPYGNSWNYEDTSNILIVGGGMGIAAISTVIEPLKKNKKNVFVAIGAKDQASLIFEERLKNLIPDTLCTTDDGSTGRKCYVTDPIDDLIKENNIDLILTCGPEIMMKRVFEIAQNNKVKLQASLERKMKCGVGLCGSCCIGEENNICVCKEGPIFTTEQLKTFPQFGSYQK